jgi:hypothetical protein
MAIWSSMRAPGTLVAFVYAALAVFSSTITASTQWPLRSVVIVTNALPKGCQLAPMSSFSGDVRQERMTITSRAIPTNPWNGSEVSVISNVLRLVDDPMQVPDGPPPSKSEIETLWGTRAQQIAEAAGAIYHFDGGLISVYALRYRTVGDLESVESKRGGIELRKGSLRVVVFGDGSVCSDAVVKHARRTLSAFSGR